MESSESEDINIQPSSDASLQRSSSFGKSDSFSEDAVPSEAPLLEEWDSYWEDINGRLTVSRMVTDSVIKGMVRAISEEASEMISLKEVEVKMLKERLTSNKSCLQSKDIILDPPGTLLTLSFLDSSYQFGNFNMDLVNFSASAGEKFERLKQGIKVIESCCGLNGKESFLRTIRQKKLVEAFGDVQQLIGALESTVNSLNGKFEKTFDIFKLSLDECKWDGDFQGELVSIVWKNYMENFQQEVWANCSGKQVQSYKWITEADGKLRNLRQQLDDMSKSLHGQEPGKLQSLGSHEGIEEWTHRKILGNHISPLWEENGVAAMSKSDPSKSTSETAEAAQLMHMKKDELISYFQSERTKLKRTHESTVQEMTEEYFRLKREYLKEKGSSHLRREKEVDLLRKKIPEAILKLDDLIIENEKVQSVDNQTIRSLESRIGTLLRENEHLRNLLQEKSKHVEILSAKLSNASKEMSRHSLVEANSLNYITKLESDMEDARTETLIREEVYNVLLKEEGNSMNHIKKLVSDMEDAKIETLIREGIYEVVLKEVANSLNYIKKLESDMEDARIKTLISEEIYKVVLKEEANSLKCIAKLESDMEDASIETFIWEEIYKVMLMGIITKTKSFPEDSDILSHNTYEICEVMYKEIIKECKEVINHMIMKSSEEQDRSTRLDVLLSDNREALQSEVEQKEKLKREIISLSASMEEKEKLACELGSSLSKQKGQYDQVSEELSRLRHQVCLQETLNSQNKLEHSAIKQRLEEALEQDNISRERIHRLEQELTLVENKLKEAEKQNCQLCHVLQEKQDTVMSVLANEREQRKQIKVAMRCVETLLKVLANFEHAVIQNLTEIDSRLETVTHHYKLMVQQVYGLKRKVLLYKQGFERRCSDLQKAEEEVDLLGDEVDELLNLLGKIYIGLNHYAPILQHYTGIMEVLKLVKSELNGEHIKQS